jgi:uncharacterized protein
VYPTLVISEVSLDDIGPLDDALMALARAMLLDMSAGQFAGVVAYFDSTMAVALPQEALASAWHQVVAQAGPFLRIDETRTEVAQQHTVVVLTAAFERARLDVQVAFDSSSRVAGLSFVPARSHVAATAPPYADISRFIERPVTVAGKWQLPGTLTLPKRSGVVPAIVLVHGSGPQDRDESIGAAAPFRDLAWGLASRGIAVLRYEKRTRADPAAVLNGIDTLTVWDETIHDAIDAVTLLRQQPEADSDRVFLLGHSLGGMLAPRIAMGVPHLAGMVVMAAPARPLEDLIFEQVMRAAASDSTATSQTRLAELRAQVARVKDLDLSSPTPRSELPLGLPATYWLDLRGYSPAQATRVERLPKLILQGGGDTQVTTADFDIWRAALRDDPDARFVLYPGLSHLFIDGELPAAGASSRPVHVSERVIEDISLWVESASRPTSR